MGECGSRFLAFSISYRFVEAKRKNGRVRRSTESTEKYGKSVFRLGETPKTVQKSTEAFFFKRACAGRSSRAGARGRAGYRRRLQAASCRL